MKVESALAPPPYAEKPCVAVKALAAGEATADQQKLALEYIVNVIAGTNNLSFRTDATGGQRETDFSEGRRYVGFYLRKIVMTKVEDLLS